MNRAAATHSNPQAQPLGRSSMRRLTIALGLLLLLAGCSTAFFYRQIDWLVPTYVNQYLPLDAGQRNLLDSHIQELLAWHCERQLPHYAAWLRAVNADIQAGRLDPVRIQAHTLQMEAFWRELGLAVSPRLAELLASTRDEQVRALLDNLREKEEEFRQDFVEAPSRKVARRLAERMEKRLRRWVGRLNDEQREAIAAWSRELAREQSASLAMRQRWREAAARALVHRHDTQRFLPALQQLITQPETTWTEAQRQQFAARRLRTQQLLLNLAQTLTERQRQHLTERTSQWAADFERLACGAGQATRQVRAAGSG